MLIVYYAESTNNMSLHYSLSCADISVKYANKPSDCVWFIPGTFDYNGNSLL